MDNLKKYLQQHSDELDSDVPGDAVWQKIQKSSVPVLPKKNRLKMMWRYAAAACVLACVITIFLLVNKKDTAVQVLASNPENISPKAATILLEQPKDADIKTPVAENEPTQPAADKNVGFKNNYAGLKPVKKEKQIIRRQITIDPSQLLIQDVEKNYAQLVNMQLQRLRITPVYAESPDYFSTFKQQLKQVEADEIAIKKDIKLHGLNDELLQQLININQQKLNVLKDLQAEIGKLNNKVKQPESRQDSSRSYYLNM